MLRDAGVDSRNESRNEPRQDPRQEILRAAARLKIVVPVTLAIIFLLLYLNFRSFTDTMIVMLSLPFALVEAACGAGSTVMIEARKR